MKNPMTIDEYIIAQPEEIRPLLNKVRETIQSAAPNATEKIAWQMSSYWQGEYLIHFCAFKKHLGIYPGYLDRLPFADRLAGYRTTKSAIQFPYDQPVDFKFIADITRWKVSQIEDKTNDA